MSCEHNEPYIPAEDLYENGEEFLAGALGVNATSRDAFGFEILGLTEFEKVKFGTGNSLFSQNWAKYGNSATARDGLGPTFNARACTSCHFKDGRGEPPVNGEISKGFLMRISLGQDENGQAIPGPGYGEQIQERSNLGVPFEAKVNVSYTDETHEYPDGSTYELRTPTYTFTDEHFGSLSGIKTSPRIGTQTIGLGLIDALPESEILKFVDEFDSDNDGISGRANNTYDIESGALKLGKYGWKANAATLKQQVTSAFHGDMGLTSVLLPIDNCPSPQQDCLDDPKDESEFEVSNRQLERITFYQATLAVPNRRNFRDESVLKGKVLFTELNCISCHSTNLKTGNSEFTPLLNNITIRPYSDFLLHDMGDKLADNRGDFLATGTEWRTQPLWGIGLIPTVNNHTFLLHDGRARTIEEAILWHGGEAETSKLAFKNLNAEERQNVLDFINTL